MGRTLALMMLTASALYQSTVVSQERTAALLAPSRLAIYYGYPSLINGAAGDVDRAAAAFADYDVIVLGDGLEFSDVNARRMPPGPGPDEHRRTRAIVERLRKRSPAVRIYGYIDLGNSQKLTEAEIRHRAQLWSGVGATGIFLDEAGYDYGVTRDRQNAVIDAVHGLGMSVFVNAFNPDDVFSAAALPLNSVGGGNPTAAPTRLDERDAFLLESFQVRLGEAENWTAWARRTAAAVKHRERLKTQIFAVTTTVAPGDRAVRDLYEYAWWSAAVWGLDGFGWGEPGFSGETSKLPPRHALVNARAIAGTRFVSPATETPEGIERHTDAGRILVMRADRKGRFVPAHP